MGFPRRQHKPESYLDARILIVAVAEKLNILKLSSIYECFSCNETIHLETLLEGFSKGSNLPEDSLMTGRPCWNLPVQAIPPLALLQKRYECPHSPIPAEMMKSSHQGTPAYVLHPGLSSVHWASRRLLMVLYQEGRCHSQRLSPSSVLSS